MSSSPDKETEDNEQHGPKVGVQISLDQADLIIQRHFPTHRAISMSLINSGYNNRVYIVTTASGDNKEEDFIIRLCGRFWTRHKTENEVCALLYLTKMFPFLPTPKVFGYCTDKEKSGVDAEYILMEKLSGVPLRRIWNDLDVKNKTSLIDQLAKLFATFLKVTFDEIGSFHFASDSVGNSFGIGVDPQRDIVHGEGEILKIGKGEEFDLGPSSTFLDYFRGSCEWQLRELKKNNFMKGAEGYEERLKRIEKFVEAFRTIDTVPESLDKQALENVPFVFGHGDLEPQNILVDEERMEITGIIDFEWAGACPIDQEWFAGFDFIDASTTEWRVFNEERPVDDADREEQEVTDSIREYFFKVMRKNGVAVPDEIPGHLVRAELFYFSGYIMPWWMIRERDPIPESYYGDRRNASKRVDAVMDKYGF